MLFNIITLFPEFFTSPLATGLMGKGIQKGVVRFNFVNPRDFAANKHRHVDDTPFGGGGGMVIQLEPVLAALNSVAKPGKVLLTSPAGKKFTQQTARSLADQDALTIICGRYEGIDGRLGDIVELEETSVAECILNGGETAALAIIESVARYLPNFLGKSECASNDTFSNGLLEYPQFTRPETFASFTVPEVLLGGHHANIALWRRRQSLKKTMERRPDLLDSAPLSASDAQILSSLPRFRYGKNLSFCLFHYPVRLEGHKSGVSSLTNLDIHDIGRISRSYGMGPFHVLMPLSDQLDLLNAILDHWLTGKGKTHEDRRNALKDIRPVENFARLAEDIENFYGKTPEYVVASASWPKNGQPLTPAQVRELCGEKPVVLCLGTARGLDIKSLPFPFRQIRPLRFLGENHLPVRSAAAILADRILGDYY